MGSSLARDWAKALLSPTRYIAADLQAGHAGIHLQLAVE
jgi:hypothetical protein